jgi:hypothetical protein
MGEGHEWMCPLPRRHRGAHPEKAVDSLGGWATVKSEGARHSPCARRTGGGQQTGDIQVLGLRVQVELEVPHRVPAIGQECPLLIHLPGPLSRIP